MRINRIEIKNFRSCIEDSFNFDELKLNGFYYVTGQNLVEPHLGANGAGKSNIIDSILWVLFGKTSTNLVGENILSWGIKGKPEVSLTFNDTHTVTRTWNPIKLTLDDEAVTQEKLEDIIGYTFKSFMYSVVIPQFASKFFDLDPAEKLKIFSDIIGEEVEKWETYSEFAKYKAEAIDSIIRNKEAEISVTTGKIEQLKSQDYIKQSEDWKEKKEIKIKELNEEINKKGEIIQGRKEEIKIVKKLISKEEKNLSKLETEFREISSNIVEIEDLLKEQEKIHFGFYTMFSSLEKEINKLENLEEGIKCSKCNQVITGEHLEKELSALLQEKERIGIEIAERKKVIMEIEEILDKEKTSYKKIKNEIRPIEEKIINLKRDEKDIPKNISKIEEEIASGVDYVIQLQKEEDPFSKLEKDRKTKIFNAERNKKYLENEVENLNSKYEMLKFWIKGFRDIRLLVIEEALAEFEIEINNNLSMMGMADWKIELSSESLTKKGTTKSGFTVTVKSPRNNKVVPFSVWSGGEKQRLLLAGVWGLLSFIESRNGAISNIEIYDEPTAWLDANGVQDLLLLLKDRTNSYNKKILLIDHRELISSGIFDGILTVTKDEHGSKITFEET